MKLNILPLNQRDSRWSSKKLGTSSVNIGGYGCVITCISMLCTYYGHEVTPDQLNQMLINVGGFAQTNLMIWEKLHDLFPDIKWDGRIDCPDVPAPLETIDSYLNKSMPVIVCVDFDPKEGLQQHFVLIIGKENNDYFINDPWTGETYFFTAKYGDPAKGIYGLRLYSGPVVIEEDNYKVVYKGQTLATYETNPIDKIENLDKEVESLKETVSQEIQNNATLQSALSLQEKDNAELLANLRKVEKERDDIKSSFKEVKDWCQDLLSIDISSIEEVRAVSGALQDLQSYKQEAVGILSKIIGILESYEDIS